MLPGYLQIDADELGRDTPVTVRVLGDMASIALNFAENLRDEIKSANEEQRPATFIIPVGPVDQFPILARLLNEEQISCREVVFINMDEYLTDDGNLVPMDHPLSFRGYMNRALYALLDSELAPPTENRVFPEPDKPEAVQQLISARGGVDVCYGGIGINGHMAFNEPPEPGEVISLDDFASLPTRILNLSRETKTINSVTIGGEISVVPKQAITVGIKEILESNKLRFYCNRPWQSAVVRRVLHGPISPLCPASLMRQHSDAMLTIAEYVAQKPDIRLR